MVWCPWCFKQFHHYKRYGYCPHCKRPVSELFRNGQNYLVKRKVKETVSFKKRNGKTVKFKATKRR